MLLLFALYSCENRHFLWNKNYDNVKIYFVVTKIQNKELRQIDAIFHALGNKPDIYI